MLRSDVAVTTLDNKIYAVGGYNGATGLKSAESYDPELNIWQKVFQEKSVHIIFPCKLQMFFAHMFFCIITYFISTKTSVKRMCS